MRRRRGDGGSQDPAPAGEHADEWLAKGRSYEQDRQPRLAIKAYERAATVRDAAVAGPACLNLGRLYEQDRQPRSAIRAYERAVRYGRPASTEAELALKRLRG